jgi:quercetin dioxygenase-like cupin family protein
MKPYLYLADLAKETPEVPGQSILSRTFFEDDQMKAILFAFAPGQELSQHTASVAAILHFVSGEAKLTLGGEEHQAGPGTWVHMDPKLTHSIKARTPVQMLLLMFK